MTHPLLVLAALAPLAGGAADAGAAQPGPSLQAEMYALHEATEAAKQAEGDRCRVADLLLGRAGRFERFLDVQEMTYRIRDAVAASCPERTKELNRKLAPLILDRLRTLEVCAPVGDVQQARAKLNVPMNLLWTLDELDPEQGYKSIWASSLDYTQALELIRRAYDEEIAASKQEEERAGAQDRKRVASRLRLLEAQRKVELTKARAKCEAFQAEFRKAAKARRGPANGP